MKKYLLVLLISVSVLHSQTFQVEKVTGNVKMLSSNSNTWQQVKPKMLLNENDVDGDGSDDFSIVIKTPSGDVGDVILYSFKRGAWQELTKFKAPESEVFGSRQNLIEFAGSGSIKYRTIEKTTDNRDSLVIKTISTW